MNALNPETITRAILGMDAWLDTMRDERGYGGPVAHRWQDCLIYAGPGFDWRYEGIISGYLCLHEATGEPRWLAKARRAADDLVTAQLPDARYPASSFEANPAAGGTPHEAACDLALLRLAARLKLDGDPAWEVYLSVARRNLVDYCIKTLWDEDRRSFRNIPGDSALVPNKICTLVEAGFALAELEGEDDLPEQHFLPALKTTLLAQVGANESLLYGAIDQAIAGGQPSGRYFPYYTARCVPALLAAFQHTGEQVYLNAAAAAMDFVFRGQLPDGSFPQVLYANGRRTDEPRWIAGCGDILRSARLLSRHGYVHLGLEQAESWLLSGILPSGGVRTAAGFARLERDGRRGGLPDFRDLLPVCGWVDKAFHYLACLVQPGWPFAAFTGPEPALMPCIYRGQTAEYIENGACISVRRGRDELYHWDKGHAWATVW